MVYRNSQSLTFEGFVNDMYASFGMSPIGVTKMYAPRSSANEDKAEAPKVHLGSGVQKEQLHAGSHLEDMTRIYLKHVQRQTKLDQIPNTAIQRGLADQQAMYLRSWCAEVLGRATIEAFFGERLFDLEPDLLQIFHTFDASSWKLLYQYPKPFAKPMFKAMGKIRQAFIRYFELPADQRQPCHYVRTVEEKQRKAGMSNEDIAIAAQTLFWAANANHSKLCFWLVANIVSRPLLLEAVREEIAPAFDSSSLNVHYLVDQCPQLDATFNEVLRLSTGASSARNVDAPTTIGPYTLLPGAKILIPYRQLHYDEEYFGPDVQEFNPARFLENKDLHRSPSFKPFGGGTTHCSGRFLAKRAIVALAATMLHFYDLEMVDKERGVPRLDLTKPTLGVMDAVDGEDFVVQVRARTNVE
ncbi:hypothetical protein MMC25_002305 [Agyrium rufum]|nr:hypothetical protein [Agyrium rufum]